MRTKAVRALLSPGESLVMQAIVTEDVMVALFKYSA